MCLDTVRLFARLTLAHELLDDTVEGGALEMKRLAAISHTFLSGAERLRDVRFPCKDA